MWDLSHGFNNESIQQNAGFTPDALREHDQKPVGKSDYQTIIVSLSAFRAGL